MSFDEMASAIKAYQDNKTHDDREKWEQVREICFYQVVSIQGTGKYKKPQDLISFPWEKKKSKSTRHMTRDEFLKRASNLRKVKVKRHGKKDINRG